ncbi:ketopantoate reductase family protein [Catenulispora yoronensis]
MVSGYSHPVIGILDAGRHTGGTITELRALISGFVKAGFASETVGDIRAVKYGKLLSNLGNVVEALCGPAALDGPITEIARREGRACLVAAGIAVDERPDRGLILTPSVVDGRPRPAGSTWQSVQRGLDSTETDFLNGEICVLGRAHDIPTPMNALLQRLIRELHGDRGRIGSFSEADVLALAGVRVPTGVRAPAGGRADRD